MNLPEAFKNRVRRDEPLGPRTSFRIGGAARYWFEPRHHEELVRFLRSSDRTLPIFVIGAGSNLLVREGTIEKIFIRLGAPDFARLDVDGVDVTAGAGVRLGRLISVLSRHDVGGYEFLAGIPGTIGGALVMNAGAKDAAGRWRQMEDIISWVDVLDRDGRKRRLCREEIHFGYRCSDLKSYVIVAARLALARANRTAAQEAVRRLMKERIDKQDWGYPSAGSFFRNPAQGEPAGRLIDMCDLKGYQIGDAQVSRKHANFIINIGQARSQDVLELMAVIRRRVYERFKIELTPEVEFVS